MHAKCDTLIILDCCDAGLAAVSAPQQGRWGSGGSIFSQEPVGRYRKELIGACSWGTTTQDRMSIAMCEALSSLKGGGTLSVATLVRYMNNELLRVWVDSDMEEHVPQAVHYLLARTMRNRIILGDISDISKDFSRLRRASWAHQNPGSRPASSFTQRYPGLGIRPELVSEMTKPNKL